MVRFMVRFTARVGRPCSLALAGCPSPLHPCIHSLISLCLQGNEPLPLPTREKRQSSWGNKKPLEFYLSADDVELRQRSDLALYYVR